MRNQATGKHEVRKVFKYYGFEVVGIGETKEEAKADLQKKLEDYRVPGSESPFHRGPKYRPKFKVVDTVSSPGYVTTTENGVVEYKYDEQRKAQVFAVDRSPASTNLAVDAKVETKGE